MPVLKFPDPRQTTEEGIVALGGDLHPDSLMLAYRQGIFPWPVEGLPMAWFCPPERGVLFFDELHVPRSLEKERRRSKLTFTFDRAFEQVMRQCSDSPRPGQDGTWITPWMLAAYVELHKLGHAHSVEAWNEAGELVGGVYGVDADGAFAGESMFFLEPNASKLALLHLFDRLQKKGAHWIDIQMITPHMQALGARLIPRARFLKLLKEARAKGLRLFA